MVPPRHYCVVINPVARDDDSQILFDQSGQAKLRHADLEIRLTRDPFPLYPGEEIQQVSKKLFWFVSDWSHPVLKFLNVEFTKSFFLFRTERKMNIMKITSVFQ